jgi:hypothetical protein
MLLVVLYETHAQCHHYRTSQYSYTLLYTSNKQRYLYRF